MKRLLLILSLLVAAAAAAAPPVLSACAEELRGWCASCRGRFSAVHCTCQCPLGTAERNFFTLLGFVGLLLVMLLV